MADFADGKLSVKEGDRVQGHVVEVSADGEIRLGRTLGKPGNLAGIEQARESARTDLKALLGTYPTAVEVVAGYVLLGKGSFDSYSAMSAGLGAPLKSDYSQALRVGKWLAFDGDADGDGVTNLIEYKGTIAQGRAVYIKTALDPVIKPVAPAQTATGWSNALGR